MAKDVASIVICDECGNQVAEILVDGKRALCSECHLSEARAETSQEGESDPEK